MGRPVIEIYSLLAVDGPRGFLAPTVMPWAKAELDANRKRAFRSRDGLDASPDVGRGPSGESFMAESHIMSPAVWKNRDVGQVSSRRSHWRAAKATRRPIRRLDRAQALHFTLVLCCKVGRIGRSGLICDRSGRILVFQLGMNRETRKCPLL